MINYSPCKITLYKINEKTFVVFTIIPMLEYCKRTAVLQGGVDLYS